MTNINHTNTDACSEQGGQTVRVWDFPTRAFHWSLALVVAVVWASSEARGSAFWVHVYAGTSLLGFVAFRAVWGVIGSRYALFGNFVHGPQVVSQYTKDLVAFSPPHSTGHNPLGGWMVLALLGFITLAVLSGLSTHSSGYVGPLAHIWGGIFGKAHEGFANLLLFLIFGHVAGVFVHGFISRENLPRAMLTGDKQIPQGVAAQGIKGVGFVRPIIALAVGLVVVWYFLR
ncbi:MAG: cytochrome b/b6 domain-containing protein [Magnetovibrio sp.]|nr:cytochrome b/b6 domain-containing protein [Magnetovibrio sp.]